jgi:type II secretory pathway component PulM
MQLQLHWQLLFKPPQQQAPKQQQELQQNAILQASVQLQLRLLKQKVYSCSPWTLDTYLGQCCSICQPLPLPS